VADGALLRMDGLLHGGLALRIHLPGREAHALQHYLPDAFGPKDLEIKTLQTDGNGRTACSSP
jgi:hypothetical protein